uniref:S26 family signal peptidase n=1 Tax=Klebsiella pneumoniae TaxID=573 RepID=UPI00373AEBD6
MGTKSRLQKHSSKTENVFSRWTADVLPKNYQIDSQTLNREITVPAGHIFVVGQTDYSWDSRFWGTVPETTITGKAYAVF